MKRKKLHRRYGRSQFVPLAAGQKVKLAVLKTPAGVCKFEVIDQAGNDRGFIEYAKEGYRFSSQDGAIKGPWVKGKMAALGAFNRFMRGKS